MTYESKKDLKKRIGVVRIPHQLVEDALDERTQEAQAIMYALMSELIVVRAESLYATRELRIEAFCPQFEPLECGVMGPDYEPVIERTTEAHNITTFRVVFRKR